MRTLHVICAALLATAATLHAGQDQKKKDDKPVLVMTGCIEGAWIRVQPISGTKEYRDRYRLRGPKQLMKELAHYNNHLVEVTGAVTDSSNTTHMGKTVQLGKNTRIFTGARDVTTVPVADPPSIDVQDYRNVKDSCK